MSFEHLPPQARYRLSTNEHETRDVDLPTDIPLYQLLPKLLAGRHGPRAANEPHDGPADYAFYGGQARERLSHEQTLAQSGLGEGSLLFLASSRRPWWVAASVLEMPPAPQVYQWRQEQPVRPSLGWLLLAGIAALVVLLFLVPYEQPDVRPAAPRPKGELPQTVARARATVTLIVVASTSTPQAAPTWSATATPAYLDILVVQGVIAAYRYTNRVAVDETGSFTRMRALPEIASEPRDRLRNDTVVGVLDASVAGWYRVRVLDGGGATPGAEGWVERWLITNEAVPTPMPQPTKEPPRLRFVKASEVDDPSCISVGIKDIATSGWTFRADGTSLLGYFDSVGNARVCGLGFRQEVTVSVFCADGARVRGGGGVPARGGDILVAEWR